MSPDGIRSESYLEAFPVKKLDEVLMGKLCYPIVILKAYALDFLKCQIVCSKQNIVFSTLTVHLQIIALSDLAKNLIQRDTFYPRPRHIRFEGCTMLDSVL